MEYFGSQTPSPSQVQDVYDFGSLDNFVTKRWRGIYIVCHFDGKPVGYTLPDVLEIDQLAQRAAWSGRGMARAVCI